MRGPYGFELNENCQTCKLRTDGFFCELQAGALKDLDRLKSSSAYPEGAVLFMENQDPRGVFILCEGQVKLSISSSEGKTMILRLAKPGEILGLTAVFAGTPYEVTAETLRPCQVAFIRRDDFLRYRAAHIEGRDMPLDDLSVAMDVVGGRISVHPISFGIGSTGGSTRLRPVIWSASMRLLPVSTGPSC